MSVNHPNSCSVQKLPFLNQSTEVLTGGDFIDDDLFQYKHTLFRILFE